MSLPACFQTPRLIGRCAVPADAPKIFAAYASDPEVTRYLVWRPHASVRDTEKWLGAIIATFGLGVRNEYVLAAKGAPDVPIGMISARPEDHMISFGYVLQRPSWGNGYMTEVLRWWVDWALTQGGFARAWAVCDVANPASARVMEKAGMTREGILRAWSVHPNVSPDPRDCLCLAKCRTG